MDAFVVKKTPKAHIKAVHVPQFIAYTNFSLGESSTLVLRRVVPQVSQQ